MAQTPKRRRGAQQREKPRADESAQMEALWKKIVSGRRDLHGLIVTTDLDGRPLAKGQVSWPDVLGADVELGLLRAFQATGDIVFADALAALQSYGLAGGKPRKSFAEASLRVFGDEVSGYLDHMRWLVECGSKSERAAAECVVAEFGISDIKRTAITPESKKANGRDQIRFSDVVEKLRKRYSAWKKAGFADHPQNDHGAIGRVIVRPAPGHRAWTPGSDEGPPKELPFEGLEVEFTNYWRSRWGDGSITVSRVGRDLPGIAKAWKNQGARFDGAGSSHLTNPDY